MERWHRDYDVRPLGMDASPPAAYLARMPESARAARAAGAAYLMKCYSSANEWAAEEEGRVIELRDAPTWDTPVVYAHAPALEVTCERCGERQATWTATDTRMESWPERPLCADCVATDLTPIALEEAECFRDWLGELSEKGRRSVADEAKAALERMEHRWRILRAPAEVRAALDACRLL